MHYSKIAAAALAALAFGAAGAALAGPAIVGSTVLVAPPPVVVEAVPAPRAGAIWMPGRHVWQNGAFHWEGGHWIANEPGREIAESRWIRDNDGTWQVVGGQWNPNRYPDREHNRADDTRRFARGDFDRDGIANQNDNDYDGDGVANWNDHFPLNASRS